MMVLRFGITLFPLIQLLNVLEFTRVKRSKSLCDLSAVLQKLLFRKGKKRVNVIYHGRHVVIPRYPATKFCNIFMIL
jgi:hypothetical protein